MYFTLGRHVKCDTRAFVNPHKTILSENPEVFEVTFLLIGIREDPIVVGRQWFVTIVVFLVFFGPKWF